MLASLIIKFVYIYISVGLTANVKGTQLTLTDIEKPGEDRRAVFTITIMSY